jgi:LmbE family N-acetylglucosaminyl deacetylase
MAHPDDETLISGSLAKPVDRGYDVIIIFVTSGDDGHDVSGQNLSGLQLAEIREQEADKSLQAIDKLHPPVFPGKMAQYCL